ncbi:PRPL34 [Auxenochlorella protothecoides x Auxenochlorella symbiontica]|uniref:50S ribosomal protein L34 n=1 Tax=Auxenochlorella protothecoides TaxID=3075 RepID=A0A087SI54_AUXPR|nr:50S ribosomal protein L34 [Auxenochlorella protothecoides]KFM25408.1 50S ribosomal protein L34 [Auxenochlorella protothecoides]
MRPVTAFTTTRPNICRLTQSRSVTVTRPVYAQAPLRVSALQTSFLSPSTALRGFSATFTNLVINPVKRALSGMRWPLLVEANNKKGLGNTLHGSRRKRARVSGFRTRMATTAGRKVLAKRRLKGRKVLCPGGRPTRK